MGVRIGKTVGFWRTDSQQNLYIESILKDMQKSQIAYDRKKVKPTSDFSRALLYYDDRW